MLDLLNPTPTQKLIERELLFGTRDVCCIGTARAGKGVAAVKGMVLRSQMHKEMGIGSGDYMLVAQTAKAIHVNSGAYFQDVCRQLGYAFKKVTTPFEHYLVNGARFLLYGGGNSGDDGRFQGATIMDAWIDEATRVREDVYEAVTYRLSFADSRIVLTSNAGSPFSWVKTTFVDVPSDPELAKEREKNLLSLEVFADENFHYSQERWGYIKRNNAPTSAMYKRMVQNVWAANGGVIYPIDLTHVVDEPFELTGRVFSDAGTAGITAALLYVPRGPDGWLVADEYYHDASKEGQLTDDQHVDRILARGWIPISWDGDPAGASFLAVLRRRGIPTRRALNDVLEGIQCGLNALFGGLLKINRWRCPELLRELAGLIWNPMTDKPQEGLPDHAADTFKYGNRRLFPPRAGVVFGRG